MLPKLGLFVCLVPAIIGVVADPDPGTQAEPQPLSAEITKAWRDAGAEVGWMRDTPPRPDSGYEFWAPWRKDAEAGAMPAFKFLQKEGVLARLPNPGVAFGLDLHCWPGSDADLRELSRLKHLQSLNIGGALLLTDAGLKGLAAMKDLRGLYLFHAPITDAGLKQLAALTNLQALDISSTRLTDAGLKDLAGLKQLRALNLGRTDVTDAGLKQLAGLQNLRWLNLGGTGVTARGVAALQKELPDCNITVNQRGLNERGQKLLDLQQTVHHRTVVLAKAFKSTPEDRLASITLAQSQKAIVAEATSAVDMLKEEGAAGAIVELLQLLREDMRRIQQRLERGEIGPETQAIQAETIDTLKELVWALRTPEPIKSSGSQTDKQPDQARLTPEQAKTALLAMMRSRAGQELSWFQGDIPDELAKRAPEAEENGWYAWTAAFRFHPGKALYTFIVRPKPGARACVFEYEGTFLKQNGVWSATPPRLVKTVLQPGG
jgi:hypothetical protein